MKKLVKFIFKLLLILIIGFVGVFFGKGYWNYLQLTETKSVDEVVNGEGQVLIMWIMMIYHQI